MDHPLDHASGNRPLNRVRSVVLFWGLAGTLSCTNSAAGPRQTASRGDTTALARPGTAPARRIRLTAQPDTAHGGPQDSARDATALRYMWLGEMYAREHRFADARAAYLKVLESTSPAQRDSAERALGYLTHREDAWSEKYVRDPAEKAVAAVLLTIGTGLIVLLLYWLLRPCTRWYSRMRGRRKLRIESLTRYLPATLNISFEEALREIHSEWAEMAKPIGSVLPAVDFRVPVLVSTPLSTQGADLAESALGSGIGKVLSDVLSGARQTEYTLSGVVQASALRVHLMVRLARWDGTSLGSWDTQFLVWNFVDAQKDFAYRVLKETMEKIHDAS
jgi:hypothetical protein